MNAVTRTTLSNGVRVLSERMPASKTIALGLWVDVGSRDESQAEGGITHFIEHMLFKGTRQRDWICLARDVNTMGGHFNAFTSPEHLCLHATVVQGDLEPALLILAEMLIESVFPEQEVANERGVILGEIAEYEDQPEDFVEEQFYEALWPGDPLGRPVAGNRETVECLDRERILGFWKEHFTPDRLVITLAGGIDRRRIQSILRRLFSSLPSGEASTSRRIRPISHPGIRTDSRDLEQIHFCFGIEGPDRRTDDRFALSVFNAMYGGGLGSRLSNEIREKRGLAYSIGSSFNAFRDIGCFAIRGSTATENLPLIADVALKELRQMLDSPSGWKEVASARDQCIRAFLLAQDSAVARMMRLGENELVGMEILPAPEVVRRLEAVTPQMIQEVIHRHFAGKSLATALVGPVNGHQRLFDSIQV
jgi:predicted Zn-dependent peptidase